MSSIPPRPPTPQIVVHHLPDRPGPSTTAKPKKTLILIMGSTTVTGRAQVLREVGNALSCPTYVGDSIHDSSAKAASVGASRRSHTENTETGSSSRPAGPNEGLYKRLWLSKLTRTGLLFPEESRPAQEGFSGFGAGAGGAFSSPTLTRTTTSRRGSIDISASDSAPWGDAGTSAAPSVSDKTLVFQISEAERLRRENPVLMALTHPYIEKWHKMIIRQALGEYGIGVIFVPLYKEQPDTQGEGDDETDDLPILRPLDPSSMSSFPLSFGADRTVAGKPRGWASLDEEMQVATDVDADIETKIRNIVDGIKFIIGID
ncbi:hypothetical protein KVR01_003676 [Diaporthe batatas]|uniref:uncharacterized protein n=1 Tax=Diaporthe batatas TaxID=748121 RepID=UPI001D03CC0D|nr:uncharacterized protein KVR01_003676 [Diaporthe batatas]KAG8167987.1 hypothetical protein KVR01_003676 [Diaporthe batatas]